MGISTLGLNMPTNCWILSFVTLSAGFGFGFKIGAGLVSLTFLAPPTTSSIWLREEESLTLGLKLSLCYRELRASEGLP